MQDQKTSFEVLPSGKQHVSFSEVKLWKECSYRHHLIHVKKIDLSKPSPVLEFGTAVHAAIEKFMLVRSMDVSVAHDALEKAWKKHEGMPDFTETTLQKAKSESNAILQEVPAFFDKEFPEWETVDAEHQLYEGIEGQPQIGRAHV